MVTEELIRDTYREAGRHKLAGHEGFKELLCRAHDDGLLSDQEFHKLDKLRRIRNPYVHTRDDVMCQGIKWIPITKKGDVAAIVKVEKDAKWALKTLVQFLRRTKLIQRL